MKKLVLLTLFIIPSLLASATHLRGGHISVKLTSQITRTCQITVTVFTDTNCSSCILFGGEFSTLNFGDGSQMEVPETQNSSLPGFPGIGFAQFTVVHVFPTMGNFRVSFSEQNRNLSVKNMDGSANTPFYIETNLDLQAGFISTPDFLATPIFYAPVGSEISISVGASNSEDYILLYQLGIPKKDRIMPVDNYRLPENISINPYSGLITWDGKFDNMYQNGEYVFTVVVSLFKEQGDSFIPVGKVSKDIQIILEDSPLEITVSSNADLDENGRIYVPVDETKTIKVFFEDNTALSADVEAFFELATNESVFSFTTYDSSSNPNIKVGVVTLTADASITKENPYLITVRGKYGIFGKDFSLLFFTQDVQPKLIEYVELITGTEDGQEVVDVYPNPSSDFFHFTLADNQPSAISIHDYTGKLVHVSFSSGPVSLDLRHLKSGFYIATISSGSMLKRLKLIKN